MKIIQSCRIINAVDSVIGNESLTSSLLIDQNLANLGKIKKVETLANYFLKSLEISKKKSQKQNNGEKK